MVVTGSSRSSFSGSATDGSGDEDSLGDWWRIFEEEPDDALLGDLSLFFDGIDLEGNLTDALGDRADRIVVANVGNAVPRPIPRVERALLNLLPFPGQPQHAIVEHVGPAGHRMKNRPKGLKYKKKPKIPKHRFTPEVGPHLGEIGDCLSIH
jgi:hypothetical protein